MQSPLALSKGNRTWLWVALALLPVLYYVLTLIHYAWNMPYMDDYPVLVDFLNRWPGASMSEQIGLLLEQTIFTALCGLKCWRC